MDWIVETLRNHSELAIFLTLAFGFFIGKLHIGKFSLGVVTSVLLVGVLVGQLDITISQPVKSVFFLMFLFAIGYKVGPQFFRGLKKDGLPQVWFAVVMCLSCLGIVWLLAVLMGYNAGEAAGLLSGSQTISAVIGVANDTINGLGVSDKEKQDLINIIPVAYAVTYIYGTAGSAWVLASIGPKMLGGVEKVKAACKELESKMGSSLFDQPGYESALRSVVFRAYKIETDWIEDGKTVTQLQNYFISMGKILYVERIRDGQTIIEDIKPDTILKKGMEVVLSGRREYAIGEENWIGQEVVDPPLLNFPVEILPVVIHKSVAIGKTVELISMQKFMEGVSIRSIRRAGVNIPVFAQTVIDAGDNVELVGIKREAEFAGHNLGYVDHPSNATDMVFVGLGILIGGLFGALAIHIGGVPISLSTSGGALIAGLVFGWWHSRRPTSGNIPEATLWFMNNVGLNMFIAVVGISAGPSFVSGLENIGAMLFVMGVIATTVPLLFGVFIGRYIFHFHPSLTLGCTAGSRTTTAALGAIQEAIQSETPSLGYTITYAVGNTLLIIWGVVIVILVS